MTNKKRVTVSEKTHEQLVALQARIQSKEGKRVSLDDIIQRTLSLYFFGERMSDDAGFKIVKKSEKHD